MTEYRTLNPEQLFKWAEGNTEIMRLRTDLDVLPGGFMAAMAPMLTSWNESSYQGTDGFLLLRNINYGGNTFERTTILQSVRVPLDGLETAELILVPSSNLGERDLVHHVQLRFVFSPDDCPELLNLAGAETGSDARIPDLVLSWESWRPPDQKFNLKEGLDESAYGLSLRGFAGPQRYLEDSIRRRDWFSYRLQLPGGRSGVRELFIVCAALGDGVGRDTIRRLLEQGRSAWLAHAPEGGTDDERDVESGQSETAVWEQLFERLRAAAPPAHIAPALPATKQTYHVLVRSCAALARYAILVATHRLLERRLSSQVVREKLPVAELEQPEHWMKGMARTDLRGLFLHAPAAIRFLTRSPSVIPAKIPDELAAAGLLQRHDGKPWMIRYGREATRPYGPDGLNRMI
jgi:hypothetical protein